jgi:glycosyltransferase involved in cell wall biosynthesis
MRVVQLGPYPPPHGGVQTNLVAIRNLLLSQGHDGLAINITRNRRENGDGVYYPRSAGELMRLLAGMPADLVHLHFGGDLTRRLLGLAAFCTALPGRRTVMTFHSGGYPGSAAGQSAAPGTLRGLVLRRFDGLIAVNPEIAAMFERFGVKRARIRTILPYVVRPPDRGVAMPERLAEFFASHRPVLLTVGLLEPEYDLMLQVNVLGRVRERYPNAGLVIAGSGSLEEKLRTHIAAQPWAEHVLLYGDMPHEVTLRATLECDVLLRTTLYDGDSVSVREALYLGTPVIATDNGMRPAGVKLVPAQDGERLLAAIEEVLASPGGRAPVAGDGQENVRAVLEFYREILR